MVSGPAACIPSQPTLSQLQYADLPRYDHSSNESVDATNPLLPPSYLLRCTELHWFIQMVAVILPHGVSDGLSLFGTEDCIIVCLGSIG